ncbi:protein phosphatase 1 regulatory subunit 37 isoform X1 [Etheostoma cragini]|uniref:protein phosphatase 1 regulatory subunit 37 isoform X1 n=2 Tax=Etheostoma cragini TaxID=417921 RepID=UPI00155ED180|nr:protein phosphatase 1 regulatory subunit 37 isoform X1 [Etheostoma cragini]XP_034723497.1 protein phosphatase 1 regulatory subunit 37 isoform X1 [Etheostoma cragini]XP_034723498.1 protein phosphatase 1 regulatory subunit 37 isoform X1 [Etheostoma cragini]XP_034723499.1 protein phosphatase 1 regulatory subunit 37 isoform X1 [Etheostoma cragini]
MNIEEQCLDLCNVKTKSNVDDDHNTTNNTEGLTPRISELMTDSNTEKPNIVPTEASETYLMPHLTDNLQAAEDNHQAQDTPEIDEVNGNRKSSAQDTPAVVNPTDLIFSNDEQHKDDIGLGKMKEDKDTDPATFVVEEGDDGGDMDIGVDLSLDESGVLETESTNVSSFSDKTLDSESTPSQDVPAGSTAESPSDPSQTSSTVASATDQAGLYPLVEEVGDKHKPSGKRVTFPSDEDIISGAVEPKDPWRHAQNVTVEEIISSYKQACQKVNCKPIPKVLKQIQELKDLTQRNECLDLKGEKLDYKACESLEEILKRVQFKVIDLEQTNLDEDGASALFDMIEYYESATHLNISFNKHIGTRGWQAAAHMMRKTSSLQYLDARNTPLLDHSAPFVARALRISGSLAVLHLENAGLSGRPLMLLATALKMNMNLRELYLADNKLNGLQDSAQLGNLLKFNYNIQILDLRNNHILDSGLAYVCEGLKEQRKGLVTLVLWNNQLTHNGMGYLAAALPCTQSLETLNLGHNSVGNEGVHKLKDGLIGNRSVLRLGLASTKLSCEGAVAVAEFIAESPRLLRLDLRENEIKTGGLMALSLALKVNTSLLRLDLDREPKKETVKSFIETQRALLAEIQNGCKRNFILAKEKEETEQKMRQSTSMAEIATEDGTTEEEEEEPAAEERGDKGDKEVEGKGETAVNEGQTSSQSGDSNETNIPQMILESDSDTEDEEDEEVVTKSSSTSNSSPRLNQTTPQTQTGVAQPFLSASCTSSTLSASPTGSPSLISGITVTESAVPSGTPPSPGRCISVSSPGRGHKIFMVTRVESPPEQLQLQMSAPAAPILAKEASKKPVDGITPATQPTWPLPSSQTHTQTQLTQADLKESSAALSTDCKLKDQSPVSHLESAVNATVEPQSTSQPPEDATASTLDPEVTDPSQQAPVLPSNSSSVQAAAFPLPKEVMEGIKSPQLEPTCVEGKKEGEEEEGLVEDVTQVSTEGERKQFDELSQTQTCIPAEQLQQPLAIALEQLQDELSSASEESKLPNQSEEGEGLPIEEKQEEPANLSEDEKPSLKEKEDIQPSQEEPCPKQQTEADEQAAEPVLSVQTDQQKPPIPQGGAEELNTPAGDASKSPEPATSESVSPVKDEDSPDESSADEDECFAEAPEEEIVGSALPNGLKPEFSLHLLDESPKPGSCVMEHVSVSCGQDLEELLLEASLEMGRDAP